MYFNFFLFVFFFLQTQDSSKQVNALNDIRQAGEISEEFFNDVETENYTNSIPAAESQELNVGLLSEYELILSSMVLIFGILLIVTEVYILKIKHIESDDTIKFILITLIVICAVFLITAGYSDDQIAPAYGLLGTIAGYLLGKINVKESKTGNTHEA